MMRRNWFSVCLLVGVALLASTGLYLALFPGLRAPYLLTVLLHVGLGLLLIPVLVPYLWGHVRKVRSQPQPRSITVTGVAAGALVAACLGFGVSLVITGATRPHAPELWIHEASGWGLVLGLLLHVLLLPPQKRQAILQDAPLKWAVIAGAAAFVIIGVADLTASRIKDGGVAHADIPPADFTPSLAATASGGLIPAEEFLEAEACGQCHGDIYHQWQQSAHRFASFNNPFYRRSVEYAAERVGFSPTKFCGACHDPLLLFSGQMDGPIDATRPEAQAGITCQVCHGMTAIRDLRGDGSYTIAPPGNYPFAKSRSPLLQQAHNLLVRLKPGPHREAMLKPFHTTPEFCSLCHKVHIPEAVNNFKWNRGQNEYDNWHHSGVSGNAVLSWGPPNPSPKICRDCHMPPVVSGDFGAKKRQIAKDSSAYSIRNHRFLAANTALPVINDHPEQLEATEIFLQDQKVSVELIAVAPVGQSPGVCLVPLGPCIVQPGQTVDLHLLVRNLGVGHAFPGGTIDSNEVWLEVMAKDATGRLFYHHGGLSDNGDVDPAAHFYKAVLLDRSAQLINKRNVHDWVSTLYARTIPPGASDVARYRVTIPPDVGDHLTIEAKLHYRKFFNWFTNFVFAGQRAPNQSARVDQYVDESRWLFTNAPVPSLPIVTVAERQVAVPVGSPGAASLAPLPWSEEAVKQLNAYGIGLLLQRDTKSAWAVLEAVTAHAPQFIEGHINLARTQIAEGSLDDAERTLRRALEIGPDYPKALYLLGKIKRDDGNYDEALELFQRVAARYPKDRVLCNEIAQLYYLQDRYQEAIVEFQNVLAIDPENLTAHYYLMLSYNAIGEQQQAQEAQARYLRYKPDESVVSLAGQHRLSDPIASLEAQPVHIHE